MSSTGALAGRRAIVTGASQGLGRGIARQFLQHGANVAICARTAADIEATAMALTAEFPQRRVFARAIDVASRPDLGAFFGEALHALGGLDCLVNNAGVHGPIGPSEDVDADDWEQAVAINLFASFACCRHAVRHFKTRPASAPRAKIINLSGGGATAPQPGLSAYGASKAAVVRFTETLAEEVRASRIDVNAVAPGALATRLMTELRDAGPERIGAGYHARVEELHAEGGMSLKKASELCVYLASSQSDGLTGRLISAAWDPWPFAPDALAAIAASDIYTLRRIVPKDRGASFEEPA
jgi:NAD(P)-dependent dehydrogenase (short-subunit alcohol dehydrogenase family)